MGVFLEPPFWAAGYRYSVAPHAVSMLVTPPIIEPLSRAEGKLRAGLDWIDGDARDALMDGFIAAARAKVEQDSGIALLEQTRDIFFDAVDGYVIELPPLSRPLKEVTFVKTYDSAGVLNTLAPANYVLDLDGGRIALSDVGVWPTDLRGFRPWVIRVVVGYASVNALKAAHPLLVHAVGLLVAHYATAGRDVVAAASMNEVPQTYTDAMSGYFSVGLA